MLLSICLIAALSPLTAIYGKKHPATVIGCGARQNVAWCQKTDGRGLRDLRADGKSGGRRTPAWRSAAVAALVKGTVERRG